MRIFERPYVGLCVLKLEEVSYRVTICGRILVFFKRIFFEED